MYKLDQTHGDTETNSKNSTMTMITLSMTAEFDSKPKETRNQRRRRMNRCYQLEEKAQRQATMARHYVIARPLEYKTVDELKEEIKRRNSEAELVYLWARSLALEGNIININRESMSKPMFKNPVEELAALGLEAPSCFDFEYLKDRLIKQESISSC
jgi:hypothetical protein